MSCLKCKDLGRTTETYSKKENYIEPEEEFERFLSQICCQKCTGELNIPKGRPAFIHMKMTQDLLRLSMNMDNIKSQIAQLIYNLTDTYIEGHNNRNKIAEVEKLMGGELPPSLQEVKESSELSRLNLWDGILKDFKESKLTSTSVKSPPVQGEFKEGRPI